jgi:hypothetical protein
MESSKLLKAMTFQERAELAKEILSRQQPVSLDEARAQVQRLKEQSSQRSKNQKD